MMNISDGKSETFGTDSQLPKIKNRSRSQKAEFGSEVGSWMEGVKSLSKQDPLLFQLRLPEKNESPQNIEFKIWESEVGT